MESSLDSPLKDLKWPTLRFLGSVLHVSPKNSEKQTHTISLFQGILSYFCLFQFSML